MCQHAAKLTPVQGSEIVYSSYVEPIMRRNRHFIDKIIAESSETDDSGLSYIKRLLIQHFITPITQYLNDHPEFVQPNADNDL